MQDFLNNKLGIQGKLNFNDDREGILDIEGSENYGRIYSRLSRNNLVEESQDSSQITMETSSIQFTSDEYTVTLLANFNTDEYKLVIREN